MQARLVHDALRELDLVTVGDGDRGRSGQQRAQPAHPGLLGGAPEEAVLDHVVLDAARAQLAPHLLELSNLEAAVLGDDEGHRAGELRCEALDLLRLRGNPAALALHLWPGLDLRQAVVLLPMKTPSFP